MYLIYSFLVTLGLVLVAPCYMWKRRKELAQVRFRERLGVLPDSLQQTEPGAIWVHAVSVGETLAVVRLVRELAQAYPDRKIFLSHVTPAGRSAGESRLPSISGRFFLPVDWQWTIRAALRRIRPSLLVIVETELWPNLLHVSHESGVRTVLVNARLSTRSFRRYNLIRPFMRRILAHIDFISAQSEEDASRFRQLGAVPDRVVSGGNLKFDSEPPKLGALPRLLAKSAATAGRGPVMVAASTMPGEEAMVLKAWKAVRERHPDALLILAPRHPSRFDEAGQILSTAGVSYIRRTALASQETEVSQQLAIPEVLLLDTIGELAGIFEVADIVFMGGSLVPTGGHNILEAAYWAKPIIFGPHMENFRDIARLFLDAGACIQVQGTEELAQAGLRLFGDLAASLEAGKCARAILDAQTGATDRVLIRIRRLLEVTSPGA